MTKFTSDAEKAAYLSAFIDGEGHIGTSLTKNGHVHRRVSFNNTDKELFDSVVQICRDLGLKVRTYFNESKKDEWSDQWCCHLNCGKANFELFSKLVKLQSPRKTLALENIISSYIPKEATRDKKRNGNYVKCKTCGKEFYASQAFINRGNEFCSIECRGISQRTRFTKCCETCGKEFTTIPSQNSRFCSRECIKQSPEDLRRLRAQSKAAAEKRWGRGG
jgi:hypothetical protein